MAKSLLEVYNKWEEESSSTMNTDGEKEQTNMRRQKRENSFLLSEHLQHRTSPAPVEG